MTTYMISGINPEQWSSPGSDRFGGQAKSTALSNFQKAVADDLRENYPNIEPLDEPCELEFYVWRQLVEYQGQRKRVRKNRVDATNVQKALEDALQGVLIKNDRDVVDVRTRIVEQGVDVDPFIIINLRPATRTSKDVLACRMDFLRERDRPKPSFRDVPVADVF